MTDITPLYIVGILVGAVGTLFTYLIKAYRDENADLKRRLDRYEQASSKLLDVAIAAQQKARETDRERMYEK